MIDEDAKKIKEECGAEKKDFKKIHVFRKGVDKEEAMKNARPSKNKGKSICKKCGKEYLTVNFHSHYSIHVK
jgi:hypothetical protein